MGKKTIYLSGSTATSPKKRNFYKILGVLLIVFSGYQIYNYIMEQTAIELNSEFFIGLFSDLNFINSLIIFCISIGLLITGFQLIGRKTNQYIRFDNNKIIYKPSYLRDSKSINIDNLKEIVFSSDWILCISDKEKFMIDLSWVSVFISDKVKEAIKKLAKEKNVNTKGT